MHISGKAQIIPTDVTLEQVIKAKSVYNNSTGRYGWYKIAHSDSTSGWGNNKFVILVVAGGPSSELCAIIDFDYYNNSVIKLNRIVGNLSVDNVKAIKNSDNTVDVYIKTTSYYQIVYLSLLLWYGQNTNPIQTEFIGDSLPTEGTQYSCTSI